MKAWREAPMFVSESTDLLIIRVAILRDSGGRPDRDIATLPVIGLLISRRIRGVPARRRQRVITEKVVFTLGLRSVWPQSKLTLLTKGGTKRRGWSTDQMGNDQKLDGLPWFYGGLSPPLLVLLMSANKLRATDNTLVNLYVYLLLLHIMIHLLIDTNIPRLSSLWMNVYEKKKKN